MEKCALFTFPSVTLRGKDNRKTVQAWVDNCGNDQLSSVPLCELHNKMYLCQKHFTDDQFYHNKKRLLPHAVPTIFDDDANDNGIGQIHVNRKQVIES